MNKRYDTKIIEMLERTALWVLLAAGLVTSAAADAQTRYRQWTDPDAAKKAASDKRSLLDELNELVNQAERARAASPDFLADLKSLIRRHDNPWRVSLVREDFSDGDYTRNPIWKVTEGKFWIEKSFGLRAGFDAPTAPAGQSQNQGTGGQDVAGQLLGAILNKALGGKQTRDQGGDTAANRETSRAVRRAAIHLDSRITNAFSIRVELTSWRDQGSLELGLYQGSSPSSGYRLTYRTGAEPSLELARASPRGRGIIESGQNKVVLEDKKPHVILWTRDRQGAMKVSIDGKVHLNTADRSLRDPFDGLQLINRSGDYIIRRIDIDGTG